MDFSMRIYLKLLRRNFYVVTADDILPAEGGRQRFRLGVGVVVSVFASGTVLVQGRFTPRSSKWGRQALSSILPANTRWQLG